jgi:hypothetical protein
LEFLDLHGGRWNPTLMLVMGGALSLVSPVMLGAVLPRRLQKPLLEDSRGVAAPQQHLY